MYLGGGLMVSGAGIQAVQAVFLLLLVFVAMFAGTCATAEGTLSDPARDCGIVVELSPGHATDWARS
jgi:hypothetical protein